MCLFFFRRTKVKKNNIKFKMQINTTFPWQVPVDTHPNWKTDSWHIIAVSGKAFSGMFASVRRCGVIYLQFVFISLISKHFTRKILCSMTFIGWRAGGWNGTMCRGEKSSILISNTFIYLFTFQHIVFGAACLGYPWRVWLRYAGWHCVA